MIEFFDVFLFFSAFALISILMPISPISWLGLIVVGWGIYKGGTATRILIAVWVGLSIATIMNGFESPFN